MTSKGITVAIGGRSGAGKTTLLQNLTGQKTSKISADLKKDGTVVHFVEVPGLKDASSLKNSQFQDLKNGFQVFVYCMSIAPNSKFQDGNPEEMNALQDMFGKDIWKHCIIAFTYSNLAWDRTNEDKGSAESAYRNYVEEYSKMFCDELQSKLKVDMKVIICGVSMGESDDKSPDEKMILAIPANDTPLNPVLPGATYGWMNILINKILHKGQSVNRILPLPNYTPKKSSSLRYGNVASYLAIVAVGAFIGYITGESRTVTIAGIVGMTTAVWLARKYLL